MTTPTCRCHNEPMGWHRDAAIKAGGRWRCKAMYREKLRKWRADNPERNRELGRKWNQANPDKAHAKRRRAALKRQYGISHVRYDEMLSAQNGVCAVCGQSESATRNGKQLRLAVDHCHDSGLVRGLLCAACNNGLGRFRHDEALLIAAAKYLQTVEKEGGD